MVRVVGHNGFLVLSSLKSRLFVTFAMDFLMSPDTT